MNFSNLAIVAAAVSLSSAPAFAASQKDPLGAFQHAASSVVACIELGEEFELDAWYGPDTVCASSGRALFANVDAKAKVHTIVSEFASYSATQVGEGFYRGRAFYVRGEETCKLTLQVVYGASVVRGELPYAVFIESSSCI